MVTQLKTDDFNVPSALRPMLGRLYQHRMEGIRLALSLPHMEKFHQCSAIWRLLVGANRSTKTFHALIESVRAWLGVDPYDKYVRRHGNSLVVARDLDNVAMLWRMCTGPQFKMIRDERTRLWRAVRPDPNDPLKLDPYDAAYREQWRDAPPLIPPRLIPPGSIAWEHTSKKIPRIVNFPTTGWRVLFRSSQGQPPLGDHYHHGLLDEQMLDDNFYWELNRGLVALSEDPRHHPKAIWSGTSQSANWQLADLYEAAEAGSENVKAFMCLIDDNPYVPASAKKAFYDSLTTDEERQVRYFGVFALYARRIYPMYDPMGVHGCEPFPVPPDWSHILVLDPATNHCATLLLAVDPEDKHVTVYDSFELSSGESHAVPWAEQAAKRQPENGYDSMVIDQQMGHQHAVGQDKTVAEHYFNAAMEAGVNVRFRGPTKGLGGFMPGSNDVEARTQALLGWLSIRGTGTHAGTPKLQVMRGVAPELDRQMKRAHMDEKRPDKRATKGAHDFVDDLEYAAGLDPHYRPPDPDAPQKTRGASDLLADKHRRQRQQYTRDAMSRR